MPSLPANQKARIPLLQLGALPFFIALMTMSPSFWHDGSDTVEYLGVAFVLLCVAGRMWSTLYIGARKNRELVTIGPYSMSRNPLYFFSMLGAAGIGLFVGSLVLAVTLALFVYLVLAATAGKEAAHLEMLFGEQYRAYERQTPMFLPRPSLYREAGDVTFSPVALKRTFLGGLLFFAALPAIELIEWLKETDTIPILFHLL